ncbi:molybdate ABC transporter substrate-binding protein [Sulfitobacter noctilucae]|uniref:molybdate ABC transporter substrate-binding protein n=1 Tax=Sulfitobacter noctilucae TaxID=1342302 RepID=UPI001F4D14CD|nr:molybdate ABC transporter substrate-binding protein [Sulfitobacter noctilucae]
MTRRTVMRKSTTRANPLEGRLAIANSAAMTRLACFLILTLAAFFPLMVAAQTTVFAAASLRGVLEEISQENQVDFVMSFGGSGTMARQVAAGAPADLVVLANEEWMDWLETQGIGAMGAAKVVAQNALVVIAPAGTPPLDAPKDLHSLLKGERLAMGQRDAVPAGNYARQWLETVGLWQALNTQLAETDNVRAVLLLVARGQTPAGVVYATDAAAEPAVDVIYEIPADHHAPIRYLAAALTPAGESALDQLGTTSAARIFAAHGFVPVAP